jgi:hypothetical protein
MILFTFIGNIMYLCDFMFITFLWEKLKNGFQGHRCHEDILILSQFVVKKCTPLDHVGQCSLLI